MRGFSKDPIPAIAQKRNRKIISHFVELQSTQAFRRSAAAIAAPAKIKGAATRNAEESCSLKMNKSANNGHNNATYSNGASFEASAYRNASVIAIWAKPPNRPAAIK